MVWPVPSKHVFLASSNLVYSSNFRIFLKETRSTLLPPLFERIRVKISQIILIGKGQI